MTPKLRRIGTSRPALAAALAVGGLALVAVAGLRLVSGSGTSDESRRGAQQGQACRDEPCRANNDASPVRGYEAPSVAVDPKDPNHIIVADANLVGGHCGWHVTFNGGRDWQDGVFERPPGFRECRLDAGGFIPAGNVTFGPSGRVYAVFSSAPEVVTENPTENQGTLLAVSTDGGRSFPPAAVAIRGGTAGLDLTRPQVTATAGPSGEDQLLLGSWGCQRRRPGQPGRCNKVVLARSSDGGRTFALPTLVGEPLGANSPSKPVMGADGSILMLFLRRFEGRDTELHVARSTDGGATFTSTAIETQPVIGGSPDSVPYDSPKLVVAPDGRTLYTVFSHQLEGNHQVFFRRSQDNGATWSSSIRLNRNTKGGAYYDPSISVAASGRIDVVFFQRVADKLDIVLWAYSTDGGTKFSPDRRVNHVDRPINRRIGYTDEVFDFYAPSAASLPDSAILVWSDTRLGNTDTDTQDTFMRRVVPGEIDTGED